MKAHLALFALLSLSSSLLAAEVAPITPPEASKLVAAGTAILVDVREPAEWAETGVAAPAVLLPKGDFDGAQKQWAFFLAGLGHRTVIVYCRSGHRAGIVGAALAEKGISVMNAGGLKDWQAAGLPLRKASEPPKKP